MKKETLSIIKSHFLRMKELEKEMASCLGEVESLMNEEGVINKKNPDAPAISEIIWSACKVLGIPYEMISNGKIEDTFRSRDIVSLIAHEYGYTDYQIGKAVKRNRASVYIAWTRCADRIKIYEDHREPYFKIKDLLS